MTRSKSNCGPSQAQREAAETLAIAALTYLASEPDHLGRFLAQSGIGPGDIRTAARDSNFLVGVLDHFASEEALLIAFAHQEKINPIEIERARATLGGVWERDIP